MKVLITVQGLLNLVIDLTRPVLLDMAVPKMLADDGGVFTFHQRIVIAFSRAGLGKLHMEFFKQFGHGSIDVFRTVIGMKTPYFKG